MSSSLTLTIALLVAAADGESRSATVRAVQPLPFSAPSAQFSAAPSSQPAAAITKTSTRQQSAPTGRTKPSAQESAESSAAIKLQAAERSTVWSPSPLVQQAETADTAQPSWLERIKQSWRTTNGFTPINRTVAENQHLQSANKKPAAPTKRTVDQPASPKATASTARTESLVEKRAKLTSFNNSVTNNSGHQTTPLVTPAIPLDFRAPLAPQQAAAVKQAPRQTPEQSAVASRAPAQTASPGITLHFDDNSFSGAAPTKQWASRIPVPPTMEASTSAPIKPAMPLNLATEDRIAPQKAPANLITRPIVAAQPPQQAVAVSAPSAPQPIPASDKPSPAAAQQVSPRAIPHAKPETPVAGTVAAAKDFNIARQVPADVKSAQPQPQNVALPKPNLVEKKAPAPQPKAMAAAATPAKPEPATQPSTKPAPQIGWTKKPAKPATVIAASNPEPVLRTAKQPELTSSATPLAQAEAKAPVAPSKDAGRPKKTTLPDIALTPQPTAPVFKAPEIAASIHQPQHNALRPVPASAEVANVRTAVLKSAESTPKLATQEVLVSPPIMEESTTLKAPVPGPHVAEKQSVHQHVQQHAGPKQAVVSCEPCQVPCDLGGCFDDCGGCNTCYSDCHGMFLHGGCHGMACPWRPVGDMTLHIPYVAEPKSYYYLRPYQWFHVEAHQADADVVGIDRRNPYDNRLFDEVYDEVINELKNRRLSSQ